MLYIFDEKGNIKTLSGVEKSYDGSKTGNELDNWETFGTDANQFTVEKFDTLLARQVALYFTNSIANAVINKPLTYSIGDGVLFRSHIAGKRLGMTDQEAKQFSNDFTELLHIEKSAVNYYQKQAIMLRESLILGDCLLLFVREGGANKPPFDLILESGSEIDWNINKTNYILGIKTDEYRRRLAVIRKINSPTETDFVDKDGNQNIIMLLNQERPGQMRGYGRNFKIISMLKNIDRVWDATIERMVMESIQLGYYQASDTDPRMQLEAITKQQSRTINETSNMDTTTLDEINGTTNQRPGSMLLLKNNENIKFTDLKSPSGNFGMANDWFVKNAAMSSGYPPEFILSEYSTSYTAHKGALNDAWKKILTERSTFCRIVDRVVNWEYLKYFISKGYLTLKADINDYRIKEDLLEGYWLGPVLGHINPLQEVNAQIVAEKAGYVSKADNAALHGNPNWWSSLEEWAEQQKRFAELSPDKQAELFHNEETKNEDITE